MRNALVIGSSGKLSQEIVKFLKKPARDFFGLTSKLSHTDLTGSFSRCLSYKEAEDYSEIEFDTLIIVASRTPRENPKQDDYDALNELLFATLEAINFSKVRPINVFFLSSFSVYPSSAGVVSESTATMPESIYGESKLKQEELFSKFCSSRAFCLTIFRLPVLLYEGVSKTGSNFLSRLFQSTMARETFALSNPNEVLSGVFDAYSLSQLIEAEPGDIILNCGAKGDITFREIAEEATKRGLKEIQWLDSDRPSVQVTVEPIESILGFVPSAKQMVLSWMTAEMLYRGKSG